MEKHTTAFRTYWVAWAILLVLTVAMIFVEMTQFARIAAVFVLVAAMAAKAGIIGGWFMHLRFERTNIVLALVLGTVITALVLFSLIAIDGADMNRLAE